MNTWSIIIGLGLFGSGVYTLYRVITRKASPNDTLFFDHQIFWFRAFFGKKHAYNAMIIFISIVEIVFGLAFLTGLISW